MPSAVTERKRHFHLLAGGRQGGKHRSPRREEGFAGQASTTGPCDRSRPRPQARPGPWPQPWPQSRSMLSAAAGAAASAAAGAAASVSAAGGAAAAGSGLGAGLGFLSTLQADSRLVRLATTCAVRSTGSACLGSAACFACSPSSQALVASMSTTAFALSSLSMWSVSEEAARACIAAITLASSSQTPGRVSASTRRALTGEQRSESSLCFASYAALSASAPSS
mmetsp:Transcript_21222/g.62705  ORF Transcript_21222/g.62705 Transcript_21222/m.62705 type:complete len:224 (+) Transcript_21222:303-974(+)